MTNRFILTPYLLDSPLPAAKQVAFPNCLVNAPALEGRTTLERLAARHEPLVGLVRGAAREGLRPVSIAGDCCAPIAVLAGLQRAGIHPVVVWLDAHGDFNTADTSPSGFLGGMPLAMMVGRGDQTLVAAAGLETVAESDVVLADARGLDPGERAALEASGVQRVADVLRIPDVLPRNRPIYVHFDCDVINPGDAPAVHYPAPGGPSLEVVCRIAEAFEATGRLVAASLTLWDFDKDRGRTTEKAVLEAFHLLTG